MILFLFLSNRYEYSAPGIYNISLSAGYYHISIIGAQGGKACRNGQIKIEYSGGHGAIIQGILHHTGNSSYQITVGSSPPAICNRNINFGGKFGFGGNSGYDKDNSTPDQSGGGGGYSSFEKVDSDFFIAISGGGSGATFYTNGTNAGGIGYNYYMNSNYSEEICVEDCFTDGTHGGNGASSKIVPGSGGGGGSKGGKGGLNSITNVYYSNGKGGSSDFNESYFFGKPTVIDGAHNTATGHGSVTIEPLVICPHSCYDCDFNNNSCIQCMDGFHLYKGSCISSCNQTSIPTYLDTDDNTCKPCLSRCIKCDNGSQCTQTKEDLCLRACSFFSDRRIFRIH